MAQNTSLLKEAIDTCTQLFKRAEGLGLKDPLAVTLATTDLAGHVTARMVLCRGFDERGFVFYTNSQSRKGDQLEVNPRAALCFYWDALAEQLRVEGNVELVSDEENDAYWLSRPRESQIASAASDQSRPLHDRETYEARVKDFEHLYEGKPLPRPAHWIGYRVVPQRIEFWQGRQARMHERTVYELADDVWEKFLLYP